MKILILKYLILVILIYTSSIIYSQTDTGLTYITNDISIEYITKTIKSISQATGKITLKYDLQEMDNINKLRFVNDSCIKISNTDKSDFLLEIKKIKEISIINEQIF